MGSKMTWYSYIILVWWTGLIMDQQSGSADQLLFKPASYWITDPVWCSGFTRSVSTKRLSAARCSTFALPCELSDELLGVLFSFDLFFFNSFGNVVFLKLASSEFPVKFRSDDVIGVSLIVCCSDCDISRPDSRVIFVSWRFISALLWSDGFFWGVTGIDLDSDPTPDVSFSDIES